MPADWGSRPKVLGTAVYRKPGPPQAMRSCALSTIAHEGRTTNGEIVNVTHMSTDSGNVS